MDNTPSGPSPSGKIDAENLIMLQVHFFRSLKLLSRTTKLVEESLTVDLS